MKKPSTTNAELIRRLADVLIACSIGETVTFDQFRRAVAFDIRQNRYLLSAAMKLANEETGAHFTSVRGVGYERLPAAENHVIGGQFRRKTRRAGRRASKFMANSMRFANDMTNEQMCKSIREQGQVGLIVHMTYEKHMPPVPEGVLPTDPSSIARESLERMREALRRTKD